MFSNRISSVFFSSAFALLLGACLLLPKNGYAAADGDYNCDGTLNVQDVILLVGWLLGIADVEACDPAEICDITSDNQAIADTAYANGENSVTPEDGINQTQVDAAYANGVGSVVCEECEEVEEVPNCFQSAYCVTAFDVWGYGSPTSKIGQATEAECQGNSGPPLYMAHEHAWDAGAQAGQFGWAPWGIGLQNALCL